MRICYISAGPFTHIGAYLDYFRAAGHDVRFVALSPGPPRSVPTYNVGLGAYAPERGKWKYPLGMLRARSVIARLKPDIVHAHYATSGGLAGLVCGREPLVVTVHGTDLTQRMASPVWRTLLKAVFSRAALVNTVSPGLTKLALSLGVEPCKIVELTLGVDTARCQAPAPRVPGAGRPARLICTRRLEPLYDHHTILEALALLKEVGAGFEAAFAGEGELRAELEDLARRRGIGDKVAFLGDVSAERIPELLSAHDIYLSASRSDGTSLSLLEAMACGLFPVVSRIPANEAWIEHGAGGLLHAVADPSDLAARILEALRRPRLAGEAASLNRARVIRDGDRRTNMRRLEGLYERLAARRVNPA